MFGLASLDIIGNQRDLHGFECILVCLQDVAGSQGLSPHLQPSFLERAEWDLRCVACVAAQLVLPGVRTLLSSEESPQKRVALMRQVLVGRCSLLPR